MTGWSTTADGESHDVLWQDGRMINLGPTAIDPLVRPRFNARGDYVAAWGSDHGHAVLIRDGRQIDLGTLGSTRSSAMAINDAGQVVGMSDTADGQRHAFLWQDGVMIDLGTPAGRWTEAIAIKASGHIAGWSGTLNGRPHAVLWSPLGSHQD